MIPNKKNNHTEQTQTYLRAERSKSQLIQNNGNGKRKVEISKEEDNFFIVEPTQIFINLWFCSIFNSGIEIIAFGFRSMFWTNKLSHGDPIRTTENLVNKNLAFGYHESLMMGLWQLTGWNSKNIFNISLSTKNMEDELISYYRSSFFRLSKF